MVLFFLLPNTYFWLEIRVKSSEPFFLKCNISTVDATIAPHRGKRRLAVFTGAVNIFPIFKALGFSMRLTGVSLVMRNFANSKRPADASASAFYLRSVSRRNSVMAEWDI